MKKLLFTLMLACSIGMMNVVAGTGKGYAIKVIENDKVVAEVNIQSRGLLEDAIVQLTEKYPSADRIEVESADDSVLL